jgi:hypothetical protein
MTAAPLRSRPAVNPQRADRKVGFASRSRTCLWQHLEHLVVVEPAPPSPPLPQPTLVVELVAMPEHAYLLVVAGPQYGVPAPGQNHQGQVVSAHRGEFVSLTLSAPSVVDQTHTSSPPSAAQH